MYCSSLSQPSFIPTIWLLTAFATHQLYSAHSLPSHPPLSSPVSFLPQDHCAGFYFLTTTNSKLATCSSYLNTKWKKKKGLSPQEDTCKKPYPGKQKALQNKPTMKEKMLQPQKSPSVFHPQQLHSRLHLDMCFPVNQWQIHMVIPHKHKLQTQGNNSSAIWFLGSRQLPLEQGTSTRKVPKSHALRFKKKN